VESLFYICVELLVGTGVDEVSERQLRSCVLLGGERLPAASTDVEDEEALRMHYHTACGDCCCGNVIPSVRPSMTFTIHPIRRPNSVCPSTSIILFGNSFSFTEDADIIAREGRKYWIDSELVQHLDDLSTKSKKKLGKRHEGNARLMKSAGRRLESLVGKTGTEKRKKKTIPSRCNPESIDDEDENNHNDGGNDDDDNRDDDDEDEEDDEDDDNFLVEEEEEGGLAQTIMVVTMTNHHEWLRKANQRSYAYEKNDDAIN
jgi:hypothetical protein